MVPGSSNLPDFMQGDLALNDSLKNFVVPPRLKQVQPTTKAPVSDRFSAGDVCLLPTLVEVAKKEQPFLVVPLFFFPEWLETNPNEAETFIRDRSFDTKSVIAMNARDPEKRKIPWDKDHGGNDPTKFISFVETLNFIVAIVGHDELTGTVASMGFSKAEHKTGTGWTSMIKFKRVPMCGGVWQLKTAKRTNTRGTWWGFDIQSYQEDGGLLTDASAYAQFKELNQQFSQLHAEKRLQVSTDGDELQEPSGNADSSGF